MELISENKIGIVKGTVMKEAIKGLLERYFK